MIQRARERRSGNMQMPAPQRATAASPEALGHGLRPNFPAGSFLFRRACSDDYGHVTHVNVTCWHFEHSSRRLRPRLYVCRECWRIRTQHLQLRALRGGYSAATRIDLIELSGSVSRSNRAPGARGRSDSISIPCKNTATNVTLRSR